MLLALDPVANDPGCVKIKKTPKTIPSHEDYERLAAALRDFSEDQRVNDFIKRRNYLIENVVRKKMK